MRIKKACADPESFVRGGPITFFFFVFFFLVSEGQEDPNTAINERDGFAGGPMMAQH